MSHDVDENRRARARCASTESERPAPGAARLSLPVDALVDRGMGGGRAGAIVALGFVAMLASSAGQSFWIALFVDDMIAGTGLTRSSFSLVYALATVGSAAMVIAIGTLFDRRGPALTWAVVASGLALGCLMMSVAAGALVAVVALALMRAFGQGSFPLVATLMVAGTFESWRGRAMSVATMGVKLGAAVLPPVAALMIAGLGWRASLQVTALVVAVLILPLALVVRRVAGPARRARPGTAVAGGALARTFTAGVARARRFPWREGGTALLVGVSATPLVVTAAAFHATSLLGESGLGFGQAAAALSVMAVGGIAGALAGGVLVDRLGVRVSLVTMNALLAAGCAILLVTTVAGGFAAFAVLGLASGINSAVAGAAWGHTFGVERLGELQGVGDAARIAAAAIGPLPLALALSLTGGYAAGVVALALLSLVAAAGGLAMPGGSRRHGASA